MGLNLTVLQRSVGSARDKDPTRTLTLRRRFAQDATGRLRDLQRAIRTKIVDENFLNARRTDEPARTRPQTHPRVRTLTANAFAYTYDVSKASGFMGWLEAQEADGILEITTRGPAGPIPWSNKYIRSSYSKGLNNADTLLAQQGVEVSPGLRGAFHQPFHADRVAALYTRTFEGLKAITATMNAAISRELALGMALGEGPEAIARRLTNRVDKIGIVRARRLARTEIVYAHNVAGLNEYERFEAIIGKEIKVLWWTAADERVRDRHVERHGRIYSRAVANTLIGEPNCRCALLPEVIN